ncbi:MAG: hypothetical protein ACXVPY_14740 [Bacteroidia bacterium]
MFCTFIVLNNKIIIKHDHRMKKVFIASVFFIFFFPLIAKCQKDSVSGYLTIGICFNQMESNYTDFNFRLSDPGSGVNVNDAFHFKPRLNLYGLETSFLEAVKPNGLIITLFNLAAAGGPKSSGYIEAGSPGIGYELKFRKLHKMDNKYKLGFNKITGSGEYSRIKLRAEIRASYAYYQYYLENDIESQNGTPIIINNRNFSKVTNVEIHDNILKLSPVVGLNIHLSQKVELRFYVKYNLVLYSYEQLYKGENRDISLKYKPDEKYFLFDANGNPINKIFSLAPFSFRIELAINNE